MPLGRRRPRAFEVEAKLSAGAELERLLALMARLRGPDGCPWDREQTLASLRPFILEEAYELVEAIDGGDPASIREELGDLLLEVVFVDRIAEEAGLFTMEEAIRAIHDKLVRRHPHVFRDAKAEDAHKALARWEEVKAREKAHRESLLDGVPRSLPALSRAQKLSSRAAKSGFDWSSSEEVREKLHEEIGELTEAIEAEDASAIDEEIGDLLFVVVNLARHHDVDAELALRAASEKFSERFGRLEKKLAAEGRTVESADMEELEAIWQLVKRQR